MRVLLKRVRNYFEASQITCFFFFFFSLPRIITVILCRIESLYMCAEWLPIFPLSCGSYSVVIYIAVLAGGIIREAEIEENTIEFSFCSQFIQHFCGSSPW